MSTAADRIKANAARFRPPLGNRPGQRVAQRTKVLCPPPQGRDVKLIERHEAQRLVARLDRALAGFSHPLTERALLWDVTRLPALRPKLGHVPRPRRALVEQTLDLYVSAVEPVLADLGAGGGYTYTANAALDALTAGQQVTDQFNFTVTDSGGKSVAPASAAICSRTALGNTSEPNTAGTPSARIWVTTEPDRLSAFTSATARPWPWPPTRSRPPTSPHGPTRPSPDCGRRPSSRWCAGGRASTAPAAGRSISDRPRARACSPS